MTSLTGWFGQPNMDEMLDFSGTIASGGTAQLLVAQQPKRAYLLVANASSGLLTLGIGAATALATVTTTTVASIAVVNGGVGYTVAPQVLILGGVYAGDLFTNPNAIGGRVATATATISAGAVNAIAMSDVGTGYLVVPYVLLLNQAPSLGGGALTTTATSGVPLVANGGSFVMESSVVTNSAISIFGATTGQQFACKVMIG